MKARVNKAAIAQRSAAASSGLRGKGFAREAIPNFWRTSPIVSESSGFGQPPGVPFFPGELCDHAS
jgi:hypothetical protein